MATTAPIILPIQTPGLSQLDKMASKMKALEKQVEQLTVDLVRNSKATKATGKAAATASGNIQRFGIAFRSTLGSVVAFYGAIRIANNSLALLGKREADVKTLRNGLSKLGEGEATLQKLQKAADKFGDSTLFNQEDFTKAAGVLTSFTDIAVKDYERVINVAGDLAETNGGAVKDSLLQLAKALNAPSQNLSALSRSGIQFTEQQKAQIKVLESTGRSLEAQSIILKEIERQYGGNAKAAADGFAGALDTLGENTRDLQETFAKGILPLAQRFVEGASDLAAAFSQLDPKIIEVTASIGLLIVGVKTLEAAFKALIGTKLVTFFAPIVDQLSLGNIQFALFITKTKLATIAIAGLKLALASLGLGLIILAVGALVNKIVEWTSANKNATLEQEKLNQSQERFRNILSSGSIPALQKEIAAIAESTRALIAKKTTLQEDSKERKINNDRMVALQKELKRLIQLRKEELAVLAVSGKKTANAKAKTDLQRETQLLENRTKLQGAYFEAEGKILELQKQRATQQNDIVAIYQIEVKQAELVYKQTLAQIRAEVQKAQLKVKQVELNTKELQVQLLIKKAKEDLKLEDRLAYKAQLETVQLAKENLSQVRQIAVEQTRGAQAVFAASTEAARYGYNQAYVAQQAERTATAQQRGASALERQAKAASSMGGSGGGGGSGSGDTWMIEGKKYTFQGSKTAANGGATIINKSHPFASTAPSHLWGASKPKGYAEGGYVSGPTNALLGEGGESEYVIPSSKMDSAMARYAKGARGESVTGGGGQKNSKVGGGAVVNVNTGPVMRMNNKDYVTVSDLNSALGSVASAMGGSGGNYGGSARVS